MAALQLPEFVVDLNSAEEDIKNLIQRVKPEWDREKIVVKSMSGGYSCLSSCVHLEGNSEDAVTVRVRKLHRDTDNPQVVDRKFEVEVVQYLSKIGLFPTVHAVFQNGYCYQYIRGKPIFDLPKGNASNPEATVDRSRLKAMMDILPEIHMIRMENKDYTQTDFLTKQIDLLENDYPSDMPGVIDRKIIQKELEEIVDYTKQFDLKITLVHGDTHPGNVVFDDETGKVTFVDWEQAHIGYHIYDVAYCLHLIHFTEITPFSGIPTFPDSTAVEESKKEILKWYFDKWAELNSLENNEATFGEFRRQVDLFGLVWCLSMVIFLGILLPELGNDHVNNEFPQNPTTMIAKIWEYYTKIKDQRLRDLKLK